MGTLNGLQIHEGEAIFFPPEPSMWDMRQTARQAVLDKAKMRPFIVAHEEMYYPNMLDLLLNDPAKLEEAAFALGKDIIGDRDGHIRCALLWESSSEGILLHRDGFELLCAYVPAITEQASHGEHELALALATLAEQASNTPIMLDRGLKSGKQSLREILHYLSEQMDI